MEIKANTYSVESDPEVEKVAKRVSEALEGAAEVDILAQKSYPTDPRIVAERHIAEEVGRMFSEAGYYAYMFCYDTGYFGYVTISKKPKDHSFTVREL